MGSKTINTEMKKLVEKGDKLSTNVHILDFRSKDNSYAIILDKEKAVELAHMLIISSQIMMGERIALTILKSNEKSMTITQY